MSSVSGPRRDLTRSTLAVLFIVGLIAAALWTLRPFLVPAVWATMIVVATWPLMLRLQARLGNRRGPAVAVMTTALLLVYVVPLGLVITTLVDNTHRIAGWADALATLQIPPLPEAVHAVPIVGRRIELELARTHLSRSTRC